MVYDPDIHHRRSIRLPAWDYSTPRAYYVTFCIQYHRCFLGEVKNGQMILNPAGKMINDQWENLSKEFPVDLDHHIVMPNHFHGTIWIKGNLGATVGASLVGAQGRGKSNASDAQTRVPTRGTPTVNQTLGEIIGAFKSITTNLYIQGVKNNNWPKFHKRFWQRNFFERVVRNDEELNEINQYIMDNPLKWDEDDYNPNRKKLPGINLCKSK